MPTIFYGTELNLSKFNASWVIFIKQNINFNFQPPYVRIFWFFIKMVLLKSCLSFEEPSVYKMSWSNVDWWKFCIHLRSLNVRHFRMVEATGLKIWHRGHLQWHDLTAKFHENLQICSKVISGRTHRDEQTAWRRHCPSFPF